MSQHFAGNCATGREIQNTELHGVDCPLDDRAEQRGIYATSLGRAVAASIRQNATPPVVRVPLRDEQVGGDHYAKRSIQVWDIAEAYDFDFVEGSALKYLLRHHDKGGLEDLKKARHCIDRLIERWEEE